MRRTAPCAPFPIRQMRKGVAEAEDEVGRRTRARERLDARLEEGRDRAGPASLLQLAKHRLVRFQAAGTQTPG